MSVGSGKWLSGGGFLLGVNRCKGASGGGWGEQGVEFYYCGWVFGDVKGLKWKVVGSWYGVWSVSSLWVWHGIIGCMLLRKPQVEH